MRYVKSPCGCEIDTARGRVTIECEAGAALWLEHFDAVMAYLRAEHTQRTQRAYEAHVAAAVAAVEEGAAV